MPTVLEYLSGQEYYPVMGVDLNQQEVAPIRLDIPGERYALDSYEGLETYLDQLRSEKGVSVLYGGYGEKRTLYQKADQYMDDGNPREYHLGVDVWCSPGREVYLPWDGTIVTSVFRGRKWDYGGLIILRHAWADRMIYTLYGHVSLASVERYAAGDALLAGDVLGHVASKEESAGWVPHLHFQCMKDLFDHVDDFPGVTSKTALDRMLDNCPDPTSLLFDFPL